MYRTVAGASVLVGMLLVPAVTGAHGPIFAFNPRTEFQGAQVYELGYARNQAGGEAENDYELGYHYGVTSDFTVGLAVPYRRSDEADTVVDPSLRAKYRFRRTASGPSMTSWTVLGGVQPDVVDNDAAGGSAFTALAYGYESLTWYRWASAGVRTHGEDDTGVEPGDRLELHLAGGWRPRKPVYGEPDLVFLTELNVESQERARRDGMALDNTGGNELFVSPGFIWTYGRHFQLRHGVQIPVYSDLNGSQDETDFRAVLELEMHF